MCFHNISQALFEMHPCQIQPPARGITFRGCNIKRDWVKATHHTCQLDALSAPGESSPYEFTASVSLSVVLRMSSQQPGLCSHRDSWPKVLASPFLALWTMSSTPPPLFQAVSLVTMTNIYLCPRAWNVCHTLPA